VGAFGPETVSMPNTRGCAIVIDPEPKMVWPEEAALVPVAGGVSFSVHPSGSGAKTLPTSISTICQTWRSARTVS
jgi:hypothetical protein